MNFRVVSVVAISTALSAGGCVAGGSESNEHDGIPPFDSPSVDADAVSVEQARADFYEVPSMESLLAAEQAMLDDLDTAGGRRKGTCVVPSDYRSDVTIAQTNMGGWVDDTTTTCNGNVCSTTFHCNHNQSFCPEGTVAGAFALKSLSDQGGGDDLAVTGVALACYVPATGAFQEWAIPQNQASGAWDISSPCNLGHKIRGANFRLFAGPTSGVDDVGVTDGAVTCTNGVDINIAVNNSNWGSWQGWRFCPSGTTACGIQQKFDPDNGSDDAAVTGIRFKCCDD